MDTKVTNDGNKKQNKQYQNTRAAEAECWASGGEQNLWLVAVKSEIGNCRGKTSCSGETGRDNKDRRKECTKRQRPRSAVTRSRVRPVVAKNKLVTAKSQTGDGEEQGRRLPEERRAEAKRQARSDKKMADRGKN